jgi:hypothetical protein
MARHHHQKTKDCGADSRVGTRTKKIDRNPYNEYFHFRAEFQANLDAALTYLKSKERDSIEVSLCIREGIPCFLFSDAGKKFQTQIHARCGEERLRYLLQKAIAELNSRGANLSYASRQY